MDRRWIAIILILLAGVGCMYLIASNSTTVGSAISVISDVTVTTPPDYITTENLEQSCVLYNKETNETIRMKCLNDGSSHAKEYEKQLKSLKKQDDIIINKNFTNKTLSMIEYENQSSTNKKYISLVFFDKCKHTFSLQMEHFTDDNRKENVINYIINHIDYDFKQNHS